MQEYENKGFTTKYFEITIFQNLMEFKLAFQRGVMNFNFQESIFLAKLQFDIGGK